MLLEFDSKKALFLAAAIEPLQEAMKNARERGIAYREAQTSEARDAVSYDAARRILHSPDELHPMLAVGSFADREAGRKLYSAESSASALRIPATPVARQATLHFQYRVSRREVEEQRNESTRICRARRWGSPGAVHLRSS